MSEITTPTKAQILKAAESSLEAKLALSKLYPDVFKPKLVESNISVNERTVLTSHLNSFFKPVVANSDKELYFQFGVYRGASRFNKKCIILNASLDGCVQFKIETDEYGFQVLIPVLEV
jgi:hypothetical protein